MKFTRSDLLTMRMQRLQNRKRQGELTPAQKTALVPLMTAIRGSLGQVYNPSVITLELTRSECLALEYAFEAVII